MYRCAARFRTTGLGTCKPDLTIARSISVEARILGGLSERVARRRGVLGDAGQQTQGDVRIG